MNKNLLEEKLVPLIDLLAACRPKELLIKFGKKYDGLWQVMDVSRDAFAKTGSIPKWAFTTQIISAGAFLNFCDPSFNSDGTKQIQPSLITGAITSHFLYSWRATQGVYRVDRELLQLLVDTDLCGSVPAAVLAKMPEWCVYVESPNLQFKPASSKGELDEAFGFFALLDPDRETGEPWLSIFIFGKQAYELATIKLIAGKSLSDCVKGTVEIIRERNPEHPISQNQEKNLSTLINPFLNILLFICSQASEIGDGVARPVIPTPKKTKRGNRFFPPNEPNVWDVGVRLGASLRTARELSENQSVNSGGSMRPHIRRAHWHGYWHGQRNTDRDFKLKWIPPIAVKVEDYETIPAVIRSVEE